MQTADSWLHTSIFSSSFKRWPHCRNLQGHPPSSSLFPWKLTLCCSIFWICQIYFQTTQPVFSCLYRPPPSQQNKLTASLFHEEFSALLDHYSLSPSKFLLLSNFHFHFNNLNSSDTASASYSTTTTFLSWSLNQLTNLATSLIGSLPANLTTSSPLSLSLAS